MKNHLIILSTLLALSSCVINLQIGGIHDGYSVLNEEQQSKVFQTEDFSNLQAGNVYELTGINLKRELRKRDTSVVEIFVNGCSGENCYPMQSYANYQEETGKDVFLIMCDYFRFDYTMNQEPEIPLFSINTEYYQENKQKKYRRLFLTDLLGLDEVKNVEPFVGRVLVFKGDSLIAVKKNIFEPDVESDKLNFDNKL